MVHLPKYPTVLASTVSEKTSSNDEAMAREILDELFKAESKDELQSKISAIVTTSSWKSKLAEHVLNVLANAIKQAVPMAQALKEAFDKAAAAAAEFAQDHPELVTLIALGVLALLVPWALEALGFAEIGIVEGVLHASLFVSARRLGVSEVANTSTGSWAAAWQAKYAGWVPKGSLFSFFQRLGMILHWEL